MHSFLASLPLMPSYLATFLDPPPSYPIRLPARSTSRFSSSSGFIAPPATFSLPPVTIPRVRDGRRPQCLNASGCPSATFLFSPSSFPSFCLVGEGGIVHAEMRPLPLALLPLASFLSPETPDRLALIRACSHAGAHHRRGRGRP